MIIEQDKQIDEQKIITALAEQGTHAKIIAEDGRVITITIIRPNKEADNNWEQA